MSEIETPESTLEKITTGDFSSGGLLKPEQFNRFFQDVQEQSEFLSAVRQIAVTAPSGDIPRADISADPFEAVAEGAAPSRQTIDQPSVPFTCTKVGTSWEVTWEAMSETIDSAEQQARQLFVNRFAVGIERLGSLGDEAGTGFAAINDGWVTIAEGRSNTSTVDNSSGGTPQTISTDLFTKMVQTMPDKFINNGGLAYMMSTDQKQEVEEIIADTAAQGGDVSYLLSDGDPTPGGRPIMTPLGWPDDTVMLARPDNLVYLPEQGGARVKQTTDGEYVTTHDIDVVYAMFSKLDYQILDAEGVVLGTNVAAPA